MGENVEDCGTGDDVNRTSSENMAFDNFVILKEFGNIVNLVKDEDFLETVPKAKLRRVKWVPLFSCLKQGIFDEMVQELSSLWEYENMPEKFEILEKQKEKYTEIDENATLWRPQLGNVKSQLKASDAANLRKQKILLESLAKEYETRVNKLKKVLSARRGYLKALQMDIQKYQKKNEDFIIKINEKYENHENLLKTIGIEKCDEDVCWTDKDLENNEIN
ncbi:hypothetical protein O3G_MSEX001616 [Manduca sexta]|uniref:Uncharacterized protein n=1 Tax=Manduca sexta TaxID=7130 RepID=A0A921YKU0_MANSE|nr:hypothetical protein O3G_MSEX001616 [Manduca sexta]